MTLNENRKTVDEILSEIRSLGLTVNCYPNWQPVTVAAGELRGWTFGTGLTLIEALESLMTQLNERKPDGSETA